MTNNAPGPLSGPIFPPLGESRSRTDLVVESIRTAILEGRLRPKEVLVERQIGEELGISKTPVREALIVLSQSGLLEMKRGRGMAVRALSMAEIKHVYEQRLLLEPWAVGQAVRTGKIELDRAEATLESARTHAVDDEKAKVALANRHFHRLMYAACENSFVKQTLDGLSDVTALATTAVLWILWPSAVPEAEEHREILNAARLGQAERAAELTAAHIGISVDRLREREQIDGDAPVAPGTPHLP